MASGREEHLGWGMEEGGDEYQVCSKTSCSSRGIPCPPYLFQFPLSKRDPGGFCSLDTHEKMSMSGLCQTHNEMPGSPSGTARSPASGSVVSRQHPARYVRAWLSGRETQRHSQTGQGIWGNACFRLPGG